MKLKVWDKNALDTLEKLLSTSCDIDFEHYPNATCPMEDSVRTVLNLVDYLIETIEELEDEVEKLENNNDDKDSEIYKLESRIEELEVEYNKCLEDNGWDNN